MKNTVIVGAGLAGWTLARELRKADPEARICIVTADSGDFYAKPSLSNAYAQRRAPAQLLTTPADAMARKLDVRLLPRTRASAIDAERQELHLDGDAVLAYDNLVLATGAQPVRAGLAGRGTDQVISINSLDDFGVLHERLSAWNDPKTAPVVVMGAGLIGCELANDLAIAGHPVTVVEPGERPLPSLLPPAASLALRDALAAAGVQWRFGVTVSHVEADGKAEPGKHVEVILTDGSRLAAAVVLSAIGLRPDVGLASSAGLACRKGIVVDRMLRTSRPGIYALGDCAEYPHDLDTAGAGRLLPYVMPIMSAARSLAPTLAGNPTPLAFPVMPVVVKTPALPVVIVAPDAAEAGAWSPTVPGGWEYACPQGVCRGFVLLGAATAAKTEMLAKLGRAG